MIHEKEVVRHQFILSREPTLQKVLSFLEEKNRRYSPVNALSDATGIKGGTFIVCVSDLKILQLVDNGDGISINGNGRDFLRQNDFDSRREVYLRAPIFRKMFDSGILDQKEARRFLVEALSEHYRNGNTLQHIVGRAASRYVEFVVGEKAEKNRHTRVIHSKGKKKPPIEVVRDNTTPDDDRIIDASDEASRFLQEFKNKYGDAIARRVLKRLSQK